MTGRHGCLVRRRPLPPPARGGRGTRPATGASPTSGRSRSRAAARCPGPRRVRDVGQLATRTAPTRCSCCTRSPATATWSGPRAPAIPPRAGGTAWSGRAGADRHRPLVRGRPQRARRLPGHHRAVARRAGRRGTWGIALPAGHDPRPGGAPRWRSPTPSASTVGRASSAARWAGCARSSGRSGSPTGWPPAGARRSAGVGDRRADRPRARRSWRRSATDPNWRGGDYHDAAPGRGAARRAGHRPPDGAPDLPQPSTSSRSGSVASRRPGEDPLRGGRYAVESYLDHHADKLVRRFDAGDLRRG